MSLSTAGHGRRKSLDCTYENVRLMTECHPSPCDDRGPVVVGVATGWRASLPAPSTSQDAPVRSPEVDVTQRVTDRVDGAVDVTQPVTCNRDDKRV